MKRCKFDGCEEECLKIERSHFNTATQKHKTASYYLKYCDYHTKERRKQIEAPLGSRKPTQQGYIMIKTGEGWRSEHTVVMEAILGRKIVSGESVHHKNGDRTDNRPENLELWVGAIRYGQRATDLVCPHCGQSYLEK